MIDNYLAEECSRKRVLGPLKKECFPQVHPSRFGMIPKGASGKWLLIVDMSFPTGSSVNGGINKLLCSLTYTVIGDATTGQRSAYRNVPVHLDDR